MRIIFSISLTILIFLLLSCSSQNDVQPQEVQNNSSIIPEPFQEEEPPIQKVNETNTTKEKTINTSIKQTEENSWYKPKPGISWQWQLQGEIDTSYDVDLYDIDLEETPQSIINELHNRNIKVICYISAGSWEEWREDADGFPESVLGKDYEGWPGEKWLDISRYEQFADVMLARLDLAVQKDCDGIEPDNIHAYQEDTGFPLTYQDQLEYNKWLAREAHKRNLSIAIKNDGEQVPDLVNDYDFAIVEECFEWDECDPYIAFIEAGKAVLGVEYGLRTTAFCKEANELNFSWLKMEYELDGKRISCR